MTAAEIRAAALEEAAGLAEARSVGREVPEDFTTFDYCDGNIDDAYEMGLKHGAGQMATELAREIRAFKLLNK